MVYKTAFNTTDSPVVIDDEGHVLGGNEWGTVETTDDAVKAALDSGDLVLVDATSDAPDLDNRARDAIVKTEELAAGGKQTTTRGAKRGAKEEEG